MIFVHLRWLFWPRCYVVFPSAIILNVKGEIYNHKELEKVLGDLADRFPGVKLNPIVKVNPALIGGVSVCVGDQILDVSVRARLMQMQAALTA